MPDSKITLYGAPWCPDCKRSKQFLGEQRGCLQLGGHRPGRRREAVCPAG